MKSLLLICLMALTGCDVRPPPCTEASELDHQFNLCLGGRHPLCRDKESVREMHDRWMAAQERCEGWHRTHNPAKRDR